MATFLLENMHLQKTAFSLVKSRLALRSPAWLFGCLSPCHWTAFAVLHLYFFLHSKHNRLPSWQNLSWDASQVLNLFSSQHIFSLQCSIHLRRVCTLCPPPVPPPPPAAEKRKQRHHHSCKNNKRNEEKSGYSSDQLFQAHGSDFCGHILYEMSKSNAIENQIQRFERTTLLSCFGWR